MRPVREFTTPWPPWIDTLREGASREKRPSATLSSVSTCWLFCAWAVMILAAFVVFWLVRSLIRRLGLEPEKAAMSADSLEQQTFALVELASGFSLGQEVSPEAAWHLQLGASADVPSSAPLDDWSRF